MIRVEITDNERLIHAIHTDPRIWATITEDSCVSIDKYKPRMLAAVHILAYYEYNVMGVMSFFHKSKTVAEGHIAIIPEYRKYAIDAGKEALELFWKETEYQKINLSIAKIYRNVKLYAMKLGFKVEGINRLSYLKNGVLHDQTYLGLLRNERC